MANPAPTINQINAFNATQGTTIDFNIIGGTELVRSNRIYIYDLSDNSLICTHLYVSTESIHELPPNTDSSIVYESGKSRADFVNGAQYYAQIQTYTDTAGTQGGSGLSVAKMFWCLVNPTLTIATIPSTISTTSYNVSATYTDTSANVVSNIIQQYQFNLYSATGSLLQSSGVVIGSGERQGTSATYGISYNFTGLSVGSSYYVVVDVTTTQGMNVSAQSGTFTVSIDTPTLGEATVVNNACDGYISVTSNLSSEYGGSASGEIASFVTDSVNNVSSLKVTFDPIQDLHGYDKPWVGGAGKNKLNASGGSGTVSGVTFTNTNGVIVASGSATASIYRQVGTFTPENGVEYILTGCPSGGANGKYRITLAGYGYDFGNGYTFTGDGQSHNITCDIYSGYPASGTTLTFKPMIRKSTESDATWQPYENICPISGRDEVDVSVVGKNFLDFGVTSTITSQYGVTLTPLGDGTFKLNGTTTVSGIIVWNCTLANGGTSGTANQSKKTIPNGTYKFVGDVANKCHIQVRGSNVAGSGDNSIASSLYTTTFTIDDTYKYNWVRIQFENGRTFNNEIMSPMILLSTETDTSFEKYNGNTYTTALGRTVYGGTLDVVSGKLTVDRGIIDFGDMIWSYYSNGDFFYSSTLSTLAKKPNAVTDTVSGIISSVYGLAIDPRTGQTAQYNMSDSTWNNVDTGSIALHQSALTNPLYVYVKDTRFSGAPEFKTALTGQKIVYELATPQTYQLTPQQIQTLIGQNNVWSDAGDVAVTYNIPITNLLVKRQDVADVSGTWLTLHSQPVTQASDMDFTFIDFTNQYGKTYKYALVPLLTQTQSGVEVEVEGGYTVSDEVQSIFDGVFIADRTGLQKCKANVGYGNVDMNQVVGSITPIGAKYPIIITNSQNQYHNGSISGTIVPDDYYFNGNLSRIDMVNKRSELEQFLTNKRAKIIKDWNGNIWLVMIMDNVSCTFNNSYGMGIVNFSTNWMEVGDPTNQQDLQATGLIDVGGA